VNKPVRNRRRGDTLIEFTLTGIPIIFICITIVECSIAMCEYESMMNAVSIAARYAASHGATCGNPNSCTVEIENIANLISSTAWIINTASMTVTFTDNSGSTTCTLSACQTNTAQFPSSTSNANAVGNPITIKLTHKLTNPLPMYWPPHADTDDAGYTLGATSVQVIQY
jgi:Flp pilus assembly protein TadG